MIDASAISCQKDASTVQHDQVSTIIYLERLHQNNANIQLTTDHCLLSGLTLSGGSSHLSTVCYQSQHFRWLTTVDHCVLPELTLSGGSP